MADSIHGRGDEYGRSIHSYARNVYEVTQNVDEATMVSMMNISKTRQQRVTEVTFMKQMFKITKMITMKL